jgi:WhiB family redox-sensing transcriptional regulator
MDTEMWFPPRDRTKYKPIADKAKAICFGKNGTGPECPVRKECLLSAIAIDEQHGIWGGLSHRERNALQRKASRTKMTVEELLTKRGNNESEGVSRL